MKTRSEMIEFMISIAMTMLWTPYIFGGNNPMEGMDCSGFVLEVMRSTGFKYKDMTSQDLYKTLKRSDFRSGLARGSVLFFGKSIYEVTHTAIAIDEHFMIEAGGGTRTTKTIQLAQARNAMVRIRPIDNRRDLVGAVMLDFPSLENDTLMCR